MELEWVARWMVGASCLFGIVQSRRGARARIQLGLLLALVGLVLAGFEWAGSLVGSFWLLLVVLPGWLMGRASLAAEGLDFERSANYGRWLRRIYPWDGWRDYPTYAEALGHSVAGRRVEADKLLQQLRETDSPLAQAAELEVLRSGRRWQDLVQWWKALPEPERTESGRLANLRALGELGHYYEMVGELLAHPPENSYNRHCAYLFAAAYLGQVEVCEELLKGPLAAFPARVADDWLTVARQAAGQEVEFAEDSSRHGQQTPQAPPLWPQAEALFEQAARDLSEGREVGTLGRPGEQNRGWWRALAAIQVLCYLYESAQPGSWVGVLYRCGAMVFPSEALEGEYWRLFTANFLHAGVLHLLMNLGGLALFGRFYEGARGWSRSLACFLVSGVGGLALVLAYADFQQAEPGLVVGASVGLMGLIGASTVLIARRHRRRPSPTLSRQLRGLGLLLLLQMTFDQFTPIVSSSGHLCGVLVGATWEWLTGGDQRPDGKPGP